MSYWINVRGFDRIRWVLFFEILGRVAWDNPITLDELYKIIQNESKRLDINISFNELVKIIQDFKNRNIVYVFNDKGKIYIYLTGDAKYFLFIYKPHGV